MCSDVLCPSGRFAQVRSWTFGRALQIASFLVLLISTSLLAEDGQIWTQWRNSLQPDGSGSELTLAENGASSYSIIVSADCTTMDMKAAQELQSWLQQITGVQLSIATEGGPSGDDHVISIGRTHLWQEAELPQAGDDLGDEGYAIVVQGNTLFLWGGTVRGAINAVFALLEEDLGCRWYTSEHARIPWRPFLTCSVVSRTYCPFIALRDPFYFVAFDENWSLRNRTNAPKAVIREEWGGHIDYGGLFVHTFDVLMPPSQYFAEHPDYYMLAEDGTRQKDQPCTTNPEVVQLVTDKVRQYLASHPQTEIISVSKNDNHGTCLCPTCKAIDDAEGSPMGSLLFLVNQVADAIAVDYPDVSISTLAYFSTSDPPATVRPRTNVIVRLCNVVSWSYPFLPMEESDFGRQLQAWASVHDRISIWDYTVNYYHYLAPMPNMEMIARNIQFLTQNNVQSIMTQGAYQSTGERDWLRSWVIAKLMWDPSRNGFELMQDYQWGHFGQSAPLMVQYNELLRNQGILYESALRHPIGGIRFSMDHPFLSEEFLDAAGSILDQAEQIADDEAVLHRVQRERLPILYVQLERGPAFVGMTYKDVLDRFASIARREDVRFLRERSTPDLEDRLAEYADEWYAFIYGPDTPNPPDQADGLSLRDVTLDWTAREPADSYHVYLGLANPPESHASTEDHFCSTGPLIPLSTYYWRVEAVYRDGIVSSPVWSFSTGRSCGDFDADGDVDQEDFGRFQACMTGTAVMQADVQCRWALLDADSDVDRNDFSMFQRCMTAPNEPVEPQCAE